MLGQRSDTSRYEAGPNSTRIPNTFPQDQRVDPNLVSLTGPEASRKVERAMGIEPTRAVRSEPENKPFGANANTKCD